MPIAFDNASSNARSGVSGNSSFSFTVGSGTGRLLVVGIIATADSVSGITYAGTAMTKLGSSVQNSANSTYLSLWYQLNPSSGANNVSITCPDTYWADASSWSGVRRTAPEASNSGTTSTLSVTTVANNSWAIAVIGADDATPAAGASTTARSTNGGGFIICDGNGPKTPPGSTSLAIAISTATAFNGVIASFAPAVPSMLAVF